MFTCSPIPDDESGLVKLAKRMKKNNISVDFVAFGDLEPATTKKLEAFSEAVKSSEGSYLAIIPPGPSLLSDQILSTPIIGSEGGPGRTGGEDGGAGEGADAGGGGGFEFGVDPSTDPELALALRMSMEEEKARQEKEDRVKQEASKEKLEGIKEEEQPLLNTEGEASGSGSGSAGQERQSNEDKKDGDGDKMDTT